VKFGHLVFEIRGQTQGQTDKQTDPLIAIFRPSAKGKVKVQQTTNNKKNGLA